MRLVLVRHPECAIPQGYCYGRLDLGLSRAGRDTLPGLLSAISEFGIGRIRTSPAHRCRVVAAALRPDPVSDPRLLELDFGAWEGQRWADIPRAALDRWAANPAGVAPGGGETGNALVARVQAAGRDILRDRQHCVIVAHGGPLKLLAAMLRGEPPDLLAPAPKLGSIELHHLRTASALNAAQSAMTAVAPRTSPVNPPI